MNNNQDIKCNVTKCKFNNELTYHCKLNKIEVSCTCDKEKCDCKEKTICNSYKEK